MFVLMRKVSVFVTILVAFVAGAVSYLLADRTAAAPLPAGKAARDLERIEQEWRKQERRHAEEMVKARLDLTEQEDQLCLGEQEWNARRSELIRVRKRIESILEAFNQPQVPQHLIDEEKELGAKEQKLRANVLQARKKFVAAEEGIRLLEREQARQRDRLYARLDAAEDKLRAEQGMPEGRRPADMQRRLQEVERELERLRRELAVLRRQVQRPLP